MVISDETVQQVLESLNQALAEMRIMAKENSDLHKEVLGLFKEKAMAKGEPSSKVVTKEEGDDADVTRKPFKNKPKPNRPSIDAGTDELNWIIFQDNWKRYKLMAGIEEEKEICLEL